MTTAFARRHALVVLSAALLFLGGAAWWLWQPLPGNVVIARLGESDWPLPDPVPRPAKVKVAGATRNAIRVAVPSTFEVEVDRRARELIFSAAAEGQAPGVRVRFRVQIREGNLWRDLVALTVDPQAPGWRDESVRLPPGRGQARRLRFETGVEGNAGSTNGLAYWGSVMAVGPSGARRWEAWLGNGRSHQLPNIVLISLDTLGARHLSAFGAPEGTSPNIDAWLTRSYSFGRAYAQYPNTLVSHASLFTGLYPVRHGVDEKLKRGMPEVTLAAGLADAGYITVAFTEDAFVASDFGFDRGFDWYDNGEAKFSLAFSGNAYQTFDKAQSWLERWAPKAPFFLFAHTYEVHTPYTPKDADSLALVNRIHPDYEGRFLDRYPGGLLELAHNSGESLLSPRDCQRLSALYKGEIHYLDRALKKFLDRQQALPFAGNTIVVLTADHGEEFCEHGKLGHGETLYNTVLHVPLGFYWPGRIERGSYDGPVELVDVMPTLLELAGEAVPPALDGISLAPLLLGKAAAISRDVAFAEMHFIVSWKREEEGQCGAMGLPSDCRVDRVAVQDERFKLISSVHPPWELLYDLASDPAETRDVAAEFPEELERLRGLAERHRMGKTALEARHDATPPRVDPATRERLRALGYTH